MACRPCRPARGAYRSQSAADPAGPRAPRRAATALRPGRTSHVTHRGPTEAPARSTNSPPDNSPGRQNAQQNQLCTQCTLLGACFAMAQFARSRVFREAEHSYRSPTVPHGASRCPTLPHGHGAPQGAPWCQKPTATVPHGSPRCPHGAHAPCGGPWGAPARARVPRLPRGKPPKGGAAGAWGTRALPRAPRGARWTKGMTCLLCST